MGSVATDHDVKTTLNFYKPNEDGSPPAPAYMANPKTFERPVDTRQVTIQNVAGREKEFTLEKQGFQYVRLESAEKEFNDNERIKEVYYKEVEQLIKNLTGATRIFIWDHTVRKPTSTNTRDGTSAAKDGGTTGIGPTHSVHVDQSYESAVKRVKHHLPNEAEHLLKGRFQIINIWRPLRTVRRDPLAVSDAHSVPEDDLVPIQVIYPDNGRTGATLSVKYSQGQKFYYKHHQERNEALIFKCFDNRAGVGSAEYAGRAKRVPHSAFAIPGTEEEEPRWSVEVRCLVFHEVDVE